MAVLGSTMPLPVMRPMPFRILPLEIDGDFGICYPMAIQLLRGDQRRLLGNHIHESTLVVPQYSNAFDFAKLHAPIADQVPSSERTA